MKYIVVIPARFKSKRLPGKPLVKINRVPMIVRTFKQCNKVVPSSKIYVATDSKKIKKVCENYKINCILTSNNCLTGTDRVAEVSKKINSDLYINVQGDEPFFNPLDLKKLINTAKKNPDKIINGYAVIRDEKLFKSNSIPKVIFDENNNLLYMSRAPIPSSKNKEFKIAWRQICAYSFPKKALKIFSQRVKKTNIESIEDIEILRFLEMGLKVKMIKMSNKSLAIDNYEDLERAKIYLKLKKL